MVKDLVLTRAAVLSLALVSCSTALAQPASAPTARRVVTNHTMTINGQRVDYRATVEEMIARDAQGRPTASVVTLSYVRTNVARPASRPVIFVFNGGPGASSVWLHMGFVGPRRVAFQDDVRPQTAPPFSIANNTETPLDVADIVLFDPPNTGFSRVFPGMESQTLGVDQDARLTCDFIWDWTERNGRWNSPKFLMGESYGTIRAAVVAKVLMGGPMAPSGRMNATTLNGVILLGQAMDFSNAVSNDRRAAITLPTFAATAWYHNKVNRAGRTVEKFFDEAQAFALGEYFTAISDSSLSADARRRIAERLSQFVGIAPSTLLAADLRLTSRLFQDSLLRAEKLQVGAYDSRYTLPLAASGGDAVSDDPAMGQYVPGFVAVGSEYFRNELKADFGVPYVAIEWATVNRVWDWGRGGPGTAGRGASGRGASADTAQAGRGGGDTPATDGRGGRGGRGPTARDQNFTNDLATAMRRNPDLRLFVGTGYYDLVTTIGSAQETIGRSPIDRQRVTFRNYESGHMPYLGPENRRKLATDVRQFVTSASAPRRAVAP